MQKYWPIDYTSFLALDAKKAFDMVNWQYMVEVLQSYGMKGTILQAIQALYTKPSAQLTNMGLTKHKHCH